MVLVTVVEAWPSSGLEGMSLLRHSSLCPGRVESARIANKDGWLFGGVDEGWEGWTLTQYTER